MMAHRKKTLLISLRSKLLILLAGSILLILGIGTSAPSALAYGDQECASSRYGSDLVCTAGDVSITGIAVAPGSPTSCIGGTTFNVDLDVTVNFATPDRWDIGIFLSNDGNDPQLLPSNGGASTCSVDVLPPIAPFLDLDPNAGRDTCGDGNGTIDGGLGYGVVRLEDVPVSCRAINLSGGNLYIPFVVSWDNQGSPTGSDCTSKQDPVPNTPSKCNAPDITNPVEVTYGTVNAVVLPEISKTDGVAAVDPGDNLTYAVTITNTTGQPLSGAIFTDPATANLNVTNVTCSATGGATCPAVTPASSFIARMQDIATGITIPDMPVDSSITFDIAATVADPVSPAYANTIVNTAHVTVQSETNSASDVDTINGAVFSDLSTSSKSVRDLNGGEADPGDVLRYTITLNETAGNAVNSVSVTDDLPANVSNFTMVSTPSGATDLSSGAPSGSNNTGYLNVTSINLPASGSASIIFDVTITAGTPAGTAIDNRATISNPTGPEVYPAAPKVFVSPSAVPTADNKQLYLASTLPSTLSRNKPESVPASATLNNSSATWSGNNPSPLQLDNTIEYAYATLFLSADSTQSRSVEARMYCSSTPGAYVTSGIYDLGTIPGTPTEYTFNLTTAAGGFSYPATCTTGNHWSLQIINHTNKNVSVHPVSGGNNSRLNLDSSNVIYVESLEFYDAAYPGGAINTKTIPGSTVYIRSTVSDPFGSFDITSANIDITDPGGNPALSDTMTMVNDSGAATKTFEYAYTVPNNSVTGNWTVKVTANEGSEGTVTDDQTSAFSVESIDLGLTKTVDNASPAILAAINYTITITNNDSTYTATNIAVQDILPAGVTYISGTPSQGSYAASIWSVGSLAPTASATLVIQVGVDGPNGTTVTNTASISSFDQTDDNAANDSASVDFTPIAYPNLTIIKTAATYSDPAHGTTNPYDIPGAVVEYTLTVTNTGLGATDADSVKLVDPIPANTALVVTDPPVTISNVPATTGLTLTYTSLNDLTDHVEFSADGTDYTLIPTADGNGTDTSVNYIRFSPAGAFSASDGVTNPSFTVTFKVRLQ